MSLPATDNFNRANGALGSNWTGSIGSDWTIVSNQIQVGASSTDCSMYWSADTPDAAQYAQLTMATEGGASDYAGVTVRHDADDYVGLTANPSNWTINWYDSGDYTQIGSTYATDPNAADVAKITASGTNLEGFINGTSRITGSNASIPASGNGGIAGSNWVAGGYSLWDNFEVGNLGAAPQTVTLDPSTATATGIPLADVKSLVKRVLDPATATATAIALTVSAPPPPQTVTLDPATLTATGIANAIDAPLTRVMDTATITGTGIPLTVITARRIALSTAALTATGISTAIRAGATITLKTATLTAGNQSASIDAPVNRTLDTATLTAAGIGTKVGQTVKLDSTSLTAAVPDIANVTPSTKLDTAILTATGIAVDMAQQQFITLKTADIDAYGIPIRPTVAGGIHTASLTATPIPLTVSAPIAITLDTAAITATAPNIPHVVQTNIELDTAVLTATGIAARLAEQQYISLDTAVLTMATPATQATASILLDEASLTTTGIALDVAPGEIAITLDAGAATVTGIPISFVTGIIVFLETG